MYFKKIGLCSLCLFFATMLFVTVAIATANFHSMDINVQQDSDPEKVTMVKGVHFPTRSDAISSTITTADTIIDNGDAFEQTVVKGVHFPACSDAISALAITTDTDDTIIDNGDACKRTIMSKEDLSSAFICYTSPPPYSRYSFLQ
ncbi:MAG: hypothetical protein KAS07_02390 [Candidatus Pacebacteria bacterium]|nr:hypothetical protein [Candidatus Paceibacterota bacterium]